MSTPSAHNPVPHDIEHVVVVGAGLAGLRTVERLRRLRYAGKITLVGAEQQLPYDRPPLSKHVLVAAEEPQAPVYLRPPARLDALDVDLRLGTRAGGLDLARREVLVDDGPSLSWDRLVLATGVRPRTVPAWAPLPGVTTLRTFEDCLGLRSALARTRRLVVVGGGVLGCEAAASARSLGLEVDLVEPLEQPMVRALGADLGSFLADRHRAHGVRLHLGTSVRSITDDQGRMRVELSDGAALDADHVLVAIGSLPNTEWLEGSGLTLDDGVVCDATGATTAEGVYAVGDVARMPRGRFGTGRLEHWTSAVDTAHHVAANLLAPTSDRAPFADVPYFWTDQNGLKLQVYGLPSPDDQLHVVDGALDDDSFLALHTRGDVVTGVSAVGRPAALARSRGLLEKATTLREARAAAPWQPAQVS